MTFDSPGLLTAAAAVGSAVLTGLVSYVVARMKTDVDFGTQLNTRFTSLTDSLQEEREKLIAIVDSQRSQIERLEGRLGDASERIEELTTTVRRMRRYIEELHDIMARSGIDIPELDVTKPVAERSVNTKRRN